MWKVDLNTRFSYFDICDIDIAPLLYKTHFGVFFMMGIISDDEFGRDIKSIRKQVLFI